MVPVGQFADELGGKRNPATKEVERSRATKTHLCFKDLVSIWTSP
jgi:hypothetical protein